MTETLPQAFVERMRGQLGEELPAFLRCYEETPLRGIRFRHPVSIPAERIPWAENAYYLPFETTAGNTVCHEAGCFYLQEPGAMLPAAVLDAQPGETVLDLCAAPGGKSTQLGMSMRGEGLLVSNEPVPKRAMILSRNIERMGIRNALVVSAWPQELAERWPEAFDAVQVDAPCSGEGMFRRHPETRQEWTPEMAAGCAQRQTEILMQAALMVRPGGRLVYSTCTLNPAENEQVVERFLQTCKDFEPVPFSLPGVTAPNGYFTVYPHRMRAEGHFVAKLKRCGEGEGGLPADPVPARPDRSMLEAFRTFAPDAAGPVNTFGDTLVSLPGCPSLRGLKVLRAGLHLGQVKGKLFIPDHAWALAGVPESIPVAEVTEEEACTYLAGETLQADGHGWMTVTCHGIPLGWGKASDGILKNHYPKGLRKRLTEFMF